MWKIYWERAQKISKKKEKNGEYAIRHLVFILLHNCIDPISILSSSSDEEGSQSTLFCGIILLWCNFCRKKQIKSPKKVFPSKACARKSPGKRKSPAKKTKKGAWI